MPWALCFRERWYAKHTVIDGYQLCFDGNGFSQLACISDADDQVRFGYENLCVTDTSFRFYVSAYDAILEFEFK